MQKHRRIGEVYGAHMVVYLLLETFFLKHENVSTQLVLLDIWSRFQGDLLDVNDLSLTQW